MKKHFKLFAFILSAGVCLSALGFSACGNKNGGTYEGEYHYASPYGYDYGVRVSVVVDNNVIKSITVLDSDYVEASESMSGEGWSWDKELWDNNKAQILSEYVGMTVDEVRALTVAVKENGEPESAKLKGDLINDKFIPYDSDLLVTGATLCSGRLLLAVQNALK